MGESVWRKVRGVLGALGLGAERSSCENKRAPHCRRIALEPLEDRRLLAVFNVNSSLDAIDANVGDGLAADAAGNTTLRAAIMEANATAASDTINLPAGTYNLTLSGFGEDAAATGDLDITQSVNILGAGAETTVIDASAIEDRIFDLFNSATVEIRDLTLTGGKASDNGVYSGQEDDGGAMRTGFYNRVSIAGCIFQGNSAPEASGTSSYGSGGAIYSLARSLVIENTQFVGNSSSNGGGAICTQGTVGGQPGIVTISGTTFSANYSRDGGAIGSSSAVTIEGSTFSSNRGTLQGGAIDNNGGSVSDLTIVNSTFKGNQSATGGAIVSFTALSLTNCTITGNTASGGGGVSVSVGTAEVQNTIIADNSASSRGPDIYGTVTSLGYNLIGDTTDSSGFGAAGDLLDVEPMLDSLADNGGGTKTCALLPGSPAIDAANTATAPETDQRGVARPFGDAADIGAYEFNSGTFSTVSLLPSADGEAGDKTPFDGTFETLDTTSFAFTVHYATSGTAIEQRALLEFNLSAIPATDTVTSVTLTLTKNISVHTSFEDPQVVFYGYAGNGAITLADATVAATELGRVTVYESSDTIALSIDPSFIQSLLGTGSYAGFRLQQDPASYTSVSFGSAEWFYSDQKPTLTIETVDIPLDPGEIHGSKWEDADGNGVWDTGELPWAGVTVYLDLNVNGEKDAGEPETVTGADGSYSFTDLEPGIYTVAEVLPVSSVQTFASPTPELEVISAPDGGVTGDLGSGISSMSSDGRYVAFVSLATDIYPGMSNTSGNVFVRDRVTGTVQWISQTYDGLEPNAFCTLPTISADGRYVAFASQATNLVADDTNGVGDVFVVDRELHTIERVSVSSSGEQGDADVYNEIPRISGDGRYVAFVSAASNLVSGDTDGGWDAFVRDLVNNTTTMVNVGTDGLPDDSRASGLSISYDGQYVAFTSSADTLVTGDTNECNDIFVRDLVGGTTERVSVAADGSEADWRSYEPALSADGRYVVFVSGATNLVPGDTNNNYDVFLVDRDADSIERITMGYDGTEIGFACYSPVVSGDGRYIVFESWAKNLVPDDTNDIVDIFLYDRDSQVTTRVNVADDGTQANDWSSYPTLSADGRFVSFSSGATTLVSGDANGDYDVFVRATGAGHVVVGSGESVTGIDFGNQKVTTSDFGDAPSPYATTLSDDGARHVATGPTLGSERDLEDDGIASVLADGDDTTGTLDDEDGVTFGSIQVGKLGATVTVNVQNAPSGAKLDAWIDFNGDGSWGGPFEQIADTVAVVNGDNTITFDVPSWAVAGQTFARFRLSTAGNLGTGGEAADGEVEDYQVTIVSAEAANGGFGAAQLVADCNSAVSVFSADVDGDGDMDVLSASYADGKIAWYENDGTESFTAHTIASSVTEARSVFAADVDGDGDVDVLSASAFHGRIAWYENDGSESFTAHIITSTAAGAMSVFAADVDGDGDLDVLSASLDDDRIAWYENDGNESFSRHTITTSADAAMSVFAADVDGDGDMDVLSASYADNKIAWYENDGSGSFTTHLISTSAQVAMSVFAADVDGDGDVDVLSASSGNDTIAWYENDGAENFASHAITTAADGARNVFAADMDGDGDVDVLSASSGNDTIAWYENDGAENFASHTITAAADGAWSVFAADLDGDGDLDVLSASSSDDRIAWYGNITQPPGFTITETGDSTSVAEAGTSDAFDVVLDAPPLSNVVITVTSGDPGEATVAPATLTFTPANWSTAQTVTVTGVDDLLVDGDQTTTITISVDAANSDDAFDSVADQLVLVTTVDDDICDFGDAPAPYATTRADNGASHVATGPTLGSARDLEADGLPTAAADGDDTAGTTDDEDGVTFGTIQVGQLGATVTVNVQNAPSGARLDAWVDFNGDGSWGGPFEQIADAVAVVNGDNTITFDVPSWAVAGATYARFRLSTTGNLAPSGAAADGEVEDCLVTIEPPDAASGVFTEHTISTAASWAMSVCVADMDGDGDMDVLSAAFVGDKIVWYENNGSESFTGHTISSSADGARSVFAADMDGDGDMDVLSAAAGDNEIVWYENNGSESFVAHTIATVPGVNSGDPSVTAADMDGDGDLDVVSTSGYGSKIAWYENDGAGSFADHVIATDASGVLEVSVVDLDGDGDMDIASAASSLLAIQWYENDGSGTFAARTVTDCPIGTWSICGADMDGDGDMDLLSGNSTYKTVDWHENDGNEGFTTHTIGVLSGSVRSVFAADVDGDGDLDAVCGATDSICWYENDGSENFASHEITASAPLAASVMAADVDGDGDLDVLAALQNAGKIAWYENLNALPGFTVTESDGSTTVSESGTTDTFTVVLDAAPLTDVVITVTSGDTGEATVDLATLTFTPTNWATAQTVTVTGVDDLIVDGSQMTTITLAIDGANSDDAFDSLADQTVLVTTTDNDQPGFAVTESDGSTTVSESGTTDTFTVVLDSAPLTDVVITVTSGDTGEATVDLATLSFTPTNWATAQTVTVTGVDDLIVDGSQMTTITLSIDAANSDDAFDSLADQTVLVTTTDNDQPGFTVTESDGSTTVSESGTTDTFTVVLDSAPLTDVVITVTSGDTGEATVDLATLTFTPTNWATAQSVTVTGVDDLIVDGSQMTTITLAVDAANSDDAFDSLADQTVLVTTTDNDQPGFTVTESDGSTTVSESGTTDTFTVVLDAAPLTDVVITVTSGDTGEATVDLATLTFTPTNWATAQTVTVTGVDDLIVDGSQMTTITLSIDGANSDDAFDSLADQTVLVTTTDNDQPGFTVTESDGSTTVSESGTTDTFTVVLDAAPLTDVVITVTSGDTGEATVDLATLTFTPTNWATAQTVTVTGVDDLIVDGSQTTTITLSIDGANSDDAFDSLADQTVLVTTTDNDQPGFSVTESDGSTAVSESGTTDTFTVVLDAAPLTDVVITVTSGDTGEATVDLATLTFTPTNWATAQTVTVTGVDDVIVDGSQMTTITLAVDAANSDDAFDSLADQTVLVTTTDNDQPGFTVTESDGSTTVSESGTTDTFTVVLDSAPLTDVVITVTSGDTGEATVDLATLTFTPTNWATAQTVTVTGVDDLIVDGSQTTTITLSIDAANSDDAFDSLADQTVLVTTTDNDQPGFTITESDGSTTVSESGTTDTFTVVLDAAPLTDVVITVTSGDTGEATVDLATLTFTPTNWATAQTVTVTGVDDLIVDGSQMTTITLSVDGANSDDAFDSLADQTVLVTTTDNDQPGFTVTESDGSTTVSESGTTDTFTVVLDAAPLTDVVITVTSGDTGEATVDLATLTFTPTNWATAQTVTLTGVDDVIVGGSQTTTITLAIDAANSDDAFDSLADQTVLVTTTDNDQPGFTVTESDGSTTVSESGTTDTFTVVLDAAPLTDVVITVTSGDTGEATVDLATLTFTPTNWATAQTVTVTGVDDLIVDGSQTTTITLAIDGASSDDAFDSLADQTVLVTTTDNDQPGFTVAESDGSTTVSESGTTDTFTVVLDVAPLTDVVITVTSGDTGEATVDLATLTFTPTNWATPQTVTLTGVDDVIVGGSQTTTITLAIDAANSDDAFDSLADQTVLVTTTDNDQPGFTITESDGSTTVSESGTTDTFTVVLDAAPLTDVVIIVTSGDTGEATVDLATLTFTPTNWATAQTVTVTGVDDLIVDGGQTTTITLSIDGADSDDAFDSLADQTVLVTTTDNDQPGFTVTESDGSTTVSESGTTDTFTVVLDSAPLTDVVITVTSGDTGEATVDLATLTFTPTNWATAQTVTVTGVDDLIVDGSQTTTITLSIDAANSDDAFDSLADQTVLVTTTDNDQPGFTVTESDGSTTVSESGTTDTFTVVLDAAPLTDVVITVTSGDTGEATVDLATLTFTPTNWATAQTVTVTGVDDLIVDGGQTTTITLSIDGADSDDAFDSLADQTVLVTTTDNDQPGFTVTESDGSTTVSESGTTDTFTVVLDSAPLTDVVITIASGDTGEATVDLATLTFTPTNWATAQTLTVTGVDDLIVDGSQTTTITLSIDGANSDDAFDSLADQTVLVTTTDNDQPGFTVTESDGSTTVSESGTTDTFTVVLDSAPLTDVVITIASGDTGEATVDLATLTFTPTNWATAQTVTLTGVDDVIVGGSQTTTITLAIDAANSDDAFDSLADQTVLVTTTDNDQPGFTVTESDGSTTVSESGTTDTFTVVLDAAPLTDVVITVTSGDTGEATVDLATLTFTPTNWATAQTVTVTGVDDLIVDGSQTTTITLAIDGASSDDAFDSLADQTVLVTTTDNDQPGFTVTESDGSTTVSESGTTDTFTVVLDAAPLTDVVITVTSGDTGEATVDLATLTFTPTNWATAQTVTVTGVDDLIVDGSQMTTITLAIDGANSDDAFDSLADQTVLVTTTDNDQPGFTVTESDGSTTVSESGTTDTFTVVLDSAPLTDVVITVTSGDTGEATVDLATLTFTPTNWATVQTVTLTGVDDVIVGGSQTTTITLSIDAANSDDAFDSLADQTVLVTTTDNDQPGFTVTESDGSTTVSESGTTDTFTVVLDAAPLTDVVITVTSGDTGEATVDLATLTFTPTNWATAQTVTVTGVDDLIVDGGQTTTITLSIDGADSDDAFDSLADQTVLVTTTDNDQPGFTVTESDGSTTVSESGTTDTFTVVLDSAPLTDVVITIASGDTGEATVDLATLTFTPTNWATAQTVTVTGVDDLIVDGSQTTTITLAIDGANSDDAFDSLADQTVLATTTDNDQPGFTVTESDGSTTVSESGTTDTFTVVLDAAPLTDVVIIVTSGDTGEATVDLATLTFTPTNWATAQTVTVTGVDDLIVDGGQTTTITLSIDGADSDDAFDSLADQTVLVTTTDNDQPGFTVTESDGSTTVSESGTTDTFTVVLDSAPLTDVVITVTSGDTGEATVDLATLTFTPTNWATAQTVTVTGVDDLIVDGGQTTTITLSIDGANSDDAFDSLADQTVLVTTTDNDQPGFTITESDGSTTVSESGTTDTFTVVLDSAPLTDVVITIASGDTGEATVDLATLTFTPTNWATAQTVTVTGVDDLIVDGSQMTTITLAIDGANSDDAFDSLADQTVLVTTTDNDQPGFTVTESDGSTTVSESGTTDTFTVVLDAAPLTDVVITVTSGDTGEATVDLATLTFTPTNWATAQTVTVTGVDDLIVDGSQTTTITLSIDEANSDDTFDSLADQTVLTTNSDDDTAGIIVTPTSELVTTEAGGQATFTVVLGSEPIADVTIAVTSSDTTEGTVLPTTLIFTDANWNEPRTVTITGVDDTADDGDVSYRILAAASSDDLNYSDPDAVDLAVVNVDDDEMMDLGAVDFRRVDSLTPGGEGLWFRLETVHEGWLTAQAVGSWTADQLTLSLYSPDDLDTPLTVSQLLDGTPRLDYTVEQGQVYVLRATGTASDVDLLLANLVHEAGSAVTVYGTVEADEFIFDAAASRTITINGVVYHYEDTTVSAVDFDGGEGRDIVWLYDSAGNESLEAWPDHASFVNGSGDDVADFTVQVAGVEDLFAYATRGGTDDAVFHGSEDGDKFKSYDDFVRLRARDFSYTLRAKKYDTILGDSGSGGKDVAVFNGSDGDDTFQFRGSENAAQMEGKRRDHTATGFSSIVVRAGSGENDVAYLSDIPGPESGIDDVFYFRAHKTLLVGAEVEVTVRAFDIVHATASESGFDVARIYDTSGDDHLEIDGDTARLYRRRGTELDLLYEAIGFERVKAYSTAGDDTTDIGEHDFDLLLNDWDE